MMTSLNNDIHRYLHWFDSIANMVRDKDHKGLSEIFSKLEELEGMKDGQFSTKTKTGTSEGDPELRGK